MPTMAMRKITGSHCQKYFRLKGEISDASRPLIIETR